MDKERKAGVALKALDDAGHGLARIARLSAIDSDGDTYAPGAFGAKEAAQWAAILPGHDWKALPLGKARVYEEGDEALAELHLNLASQAGRDWHAALKFDLEGCCGSDAGAAPSIQEWSYGFHILDSAKEQRDGETVRVLKRLKVYEVSPVVMGAGVGTGTLAMKSRAFADQLDLLAAAVADAVGRAKEVAALRAAKGQALSAERLAQLGGLQHQLDALAAAGGELQALLGAGVGDAGGGKDAAEEARLAAELTALESAFLAGLRKKRF